MAKSRINFVGKRNVRLLVIENIVPNLGGQNRGGTWKCLCDCGNTFIVEGHRLKDRESCGCLWKENMKKASQIKRKFSKATVSAQYQRYKTTCKEKNRKPLSRSDWEGIVFKPCIYCGKIDIRNVAAGLGYQHKECGKNLDFQDIKKYELPINGIDRIDSSVGYVISNCVPCCWACNTMKMDHSVNDFFSKIKQIHEYRYSRAP